MEIPLFVVVVAAEMVPEIFLKRAEGVSAH
jgi:hypothetical protein